jgi:YD repeat-containing protein
MKHHRQQCAVCKLTGAHRVRYDAANRLTQITNPLGGVRETRYDALGQTTATLDERGQTQSAYRYDLAGRLIENRDAAGNATAYAYDRALTTPSRITYPGFTRAFTYDARDRLIKTEDTAHPAQGENPAPSQTLTSTTAYDKKGRSIQTTDRNGQITRLAYDALDRLTAVTDALGGITRFTYDRRDNLIAVTDASGNTTRYDYDKNNRRIKETRPLGQSQTYTYDETGKLTRIQDAKGNRIDLTYDAAGRRTQETHTPAGSSAPARSIAYLYNAVGNLTGVTDSNTVHPDHLAHGATYTLDALGRKTKEDILLGNSTHRLETDYIGRGIRSGWRGELTSMYM